MARAAAHVFVADPEHPALHPLDRHHLLKVLRLRAGEVVTVSDGAGRWRWCRFAAGAGSGPGLEPVGDVESDPRPSPPVAVGFALTKGAKPELAVQKLTELGVDRIGPFSAERSVVRWSPEQAAGHVERWQRVAREAAMQSRRTWLPDIADVATFADLVARPGTALAAPGGGPPSPAVHALVLVGPEGGWSEAELDEAAAHGCPSVGLGRHVLRAETAAIAAGALLAAVRDGLLSRPES